MTREHVERAVAAFRDRFSRVGLFENVLYAGIEPLLSELVTNGTTLYLATSKMRPFAERILAHFDLARFFSGVYGAEPEGRFDDKVELLAHLLATERLARDETIMIGDRSHDIRAAKHNGLRAIGVTWGYGSPDELHTAGADHVCAQPSDIIAALAQLATHGRDG